MKLDITKLPVLEAVIGFLLIALVITFYLGFTWVNDENGEGDASAASETPAATPAPAGSTLVVSMQDNSFDPDAYIVASGANVTFDLTNNGNAIHDMHIAGPGGDYDSDAAVVSDPDQMSGGDTGTLAWQAPAGPGEIDFRCDFHPDQMTGVITVQ
jgi:plastocyanin